MSYAPCQNPNCKSYGQPHPNCKCHGGYAAGGGVGPFCSVQRAHANDCEYFAEGGEVEIPQGWEVESDGEEATDIPEGWEVEGGGGDIPESEPSFGEKAEALKQGLAQGFLGPASGPILEYGINPLSPKSFIKGGINALLGKKVGPNAEEQKAIEEANPELVAAGEVAGLVGGALTGTGQAGLAAKASEAMTGVKFIQTAIQAGLLQASDETSKWIMGQEPADAVGALTSIGASTLFGGLVGGVASSVGKSASYGLKKVSEAKLGTYLTNWLEGIAAASKGVEGAEALAKVGQKSGAFKDGIKSFKSLVPTGSAMLGAQYGYQKDGLYGVLPGALEGAAIGFAANGVRKAAGKFLAPAILRVASSGTVQGVASAIDHASQIAKGADSIEQAINSIFKPGPALMSKAVGAYGGRNIKDDLDTFLGNGGIDQNIQENLYEMSEMPEGYAAGGEVKKERRQEQRTPKPAVRSDDGVAIHYPEQNVMLNAARGRISNYLKGLRPMPNMPKLPFDDEPDSRQQRKTYDRALSVAVAPMSVMEEIQKGTIEPEHVKHLAAMYPELTGLLQKKVTEKILRAQMDGKKPPYKVRQGLSILLGTPLSGEMTPQAIQAAQSVFAQNKAPQQGAPQGQKVSGDKSKLSKSDQAYLTGPQARQKRAQRPT